MKKKIALAFTTLTFLLSIALPSLAYTCSEEGRICTPRTSCCGDFMICDIPPDSNAGICKTPTAKEWCEGEDGFWHEGLKECFIGGGAPSSGSAPSEPCEEYRFVEFEYIGKPEYTYVSLDLQTYFFVLGFIRSILITLNFFILIIVLHERPA